MAPLIAPHPVPHNQYNFSAGRRIRELQASNEILISDIARDTRVKSISNSRIKDDLGRSPGVNATQDHRRRILPAGSSSFLRQIVVRLHLPQTETSISLLKALDNLVRCQLVSLRLR